MQRAHKECIIPRDKINSLKESAPAEFAAWAQAQAESEGGAEAEKKTL